ncbi:MAG TPA: TetR/AcrR family transcriptional regulator [Myxococcota bacterium]|nr:TetR/AcrR family transcriptional regulator [Myxococcota bacterium]
MSETRSARTKEEVVKDFRTTEIVRAARRVIAEAGFDDASMERIAHEAGIAKGTIYLYFRNKEELLAHVADHGYGELMERARARVERARGSRAKLVALLRASLEHTSENREIFRVLQERAQFGLQRASPLATKLEENREHLLRYVSDLVESGVKSRELRSCDPQRAARYLIESLRGAIIDRAASNARTGVEGDAEAIADFFLHGVGATEKK